MAAVRGLSPAPWLPPVKGDQVRRRFRTKFALALLTAAALCGTVLHQGSAQAVATGGDFIVRCFFNTKVAAMDPILDPGTSPTEHMHVFFGNLIQGTLGFPSITSGDAGRPNTMELGSNGVDPQPTNCQDSFDTAGYWQPEPYLGGQPYLGPDGTGCTSSCSTSNDMHLRVYYLPNATPNASQTDQRIQEIPDGAIMVTGFPNGCNGVSAGSHGCSSSTDFPQDFSIVRYDCGANNQLPVVTPASAWPYNCNPYVTDSDDGFNDGIVAFTDFPDCWNGQKDWTAPNNANGKVAGYVAPWIPDSSAPKDPITGLRANDFTYVSPGSACPQDFPIAVVQLEERFHLLTMGTGFGNPSTCANEGRQWNSSSDNAERTDGGPAPVTCQTQASPSTNINLSFACNPKTSGGDSNCTQQVTSAGCAGGPCFIGANPHGWETLHADYWQTWQEGIGDAAGGNTDVSNPPDPTPGAFRDLIEDCSNEIAAGSPTSCSFINTTTQTPGNNRVFYTNTENS
jgi:Domain of unknown function (DUF1996)